MRHELLDVAFLTQGDRAVGVAVDVDVEQVVDLAFVVDLPTLLQGVDERVVERAGTVMRIENEFCKSVKRISVCVPFVTSNIVGNIWPNT